ncbi:TRAP transporter large permease subunit [Aliarcobacter skirrowii]|uniref:TRAP transporter large permease n=1 Tax=Aliarcobacter skirrowii TaxID=28200 RepID=UPI0029A898A3|nr:TRAP transporter large permease subunit [Aliarcobacter skirrowii]MDX4060675.1 TRAP transporter large permease subunit [Aliarcobacter skirrowii]
MVIATLFILLFALMLVGVPVAIALGFSTLASAFLYTNLDLMGMSSKIFDGLNHYTLMAIPMFVLAGSLLARGSAARRIIDFAKSLVGHLPGGLPIAAILASIIFAAISGSSPATVAAIGSVMYGAIKQAGYNEQFAIGTITTSGTLGILIPPSVVFIVYGVIAEQSIGKLFMAGVIPGLMIGGMMMIATYILAKRSGFKAGKMASLSEIFRAFKDSFWALLIIFVVIGGIYGGIFTPTEAGAVSVIYAFFISYFVYKDMKIKELYKILLDSAQTSSMIFFIIASAMLFAHFLADERIPHEITQMIMNANISPLMFLLIVNILLLIMGQFMEPSSVIMITVPLLLPIGIALGIDPIHLGVIMVVNMEIGMLTPPVGLNLFVASGITGLSMGQVIKASLPMTLVLLFGLMLVTYIPAISLWLPNLMYGY